MDTLAKRLVEPILVLLISSLGATYFLYLLLQDLKNTQRGVGIEIATLKSGDQAIKRKSRRSLVWSPVDTGARLFLKDAISVGPSSFAVIETKDRALIEVGPNSLIQLNNTEDFTANFVRGTFIVRSNKEDTKIEIKNGTKFTEKIAARLLSPRPGKLSYTESGKPVPVHFEWSLPEKNATLGKKEIFLEISSSRSLAHSQRFKIEDAKRGNQSLDFAKRGTFYWRMVDAERPLTEIRSFKILEVEQPKIASTSGSTLSWTSDTIEPEKVFVEYKSKNYPTPQRLLVSASATQVSLTSLEDGHYTVRLIRQYGEKEWASEPTELVVQKAPPYELTPLYPTADTELPPAKLVHFIWKTNNPNLPVIFEIESEGKVVLSKRLTAQSFIWKNESLGKYRWRVQPDSKETKSDWIGFVRNEEKKPIEPIAPPPPPKPVQTIKRDRLRAPKGLSVEVE